MSHSTLRSPAMAKPSLRSPSKAPATRRRYTGPPWREQRTRGATLLSGKEAFLRKLLWQERERREKLERELERVRLTVGELRAALQCSVDRRPEVATTDPYLIAE